DCVAIQEALKPIKTNKVGSTGARDYHYADLVRVWAILKPLMLAYSFFVTHNICNDGVKTVVRHISGKELSSFIPLSGTSPQDKGKEITYYKRYNLSAIFNLVVEGEDNDAEGVIEEPFKTTTPKTAKSPIVAEPVFVQEMKAEAKRLGLDTMKKLKEFVSIKGIEFNPDNLNREVCEIVTNSLKKVKK
ncbi:ERF family protein, partial [Patescibacteria group bacterium]|nr:ERF family protein [Patescibacteria group bacterium]